MQESELQGLVVVRASPRTSWFHWGRALRMALTSSATAVKANSNWSWRQQETTSQSEAAKSQTLSQVFFWEGLKSEVKVLNKERLQKQIGMIANIPS